MFFPSSHLRLYAKCWWSLTKFHVITIEAYFNVYVANICFSEAKMEEPWFTSERGFWVEWRNEILYKRHRHNNETYFFLNPQNVKVNAFLQPCCCAFYFYCVTIVLKVMSMQMKYKNFVDKCPTLWKKQHKPYKTNVGRNCFWASVAIPAFLYFLLLQSKKIVLPKIDCNASKSREKIPELTLWTNIHFHTVTKHFFFSWMSKAFTTPRQTAVASITSSSQSAPCWAVFKCIMYPSIYMMETWTKYWSGSCTL